MVKDHSDSKKGNLMPALYKLLFSISSQGSFLCTTPQGSTYHGLCYTSQGALAVTRKHTMGPLCQIDLMTHHTMSGCSTTELYLASDFISIQ